MHRIGQTGVVGLLIGLAACQQALQPYVPILPEQLTPQTIPSIVVPESDAVVAYGPEPRQVGEWRMPRGAGPFPAVLMIHGGCWHDAMADRSFFAPLAEVFADNGIASFNIDYRSLGVDGAGWPGTWQDWAAASSKFDELVGQHDIDRSRLVVMGHSAGVSAAWWLAVRQSMGDDPVETDVEPVRFSQAIYLDGPPDIGLVAPVVDRACPPGTFNSFFGGAPEDPPEYLLRLSVSEHPAPEVRQIFVDAQMMNAIDNGRTLAIMSEAGSRVERLSFPASGHLRMAIAGTAEQAQWNDEIISIIRND